ncbi:MAG: DNA polymerase III subunit delta [Rikenellaceae bacterium]|nr:DNA polymerase III subunit delta [Rikenellaceae bacterium]
MAKSGKITFKESAEQFNVLLASIRKREFAPIYLLMGEEPFFIDRLGDELACAVLEESERAFNQTVVYGKDTDGGTVVNLCRQMPMMGGKMVIIIKEAQQLKKIEQLAAYTQHPQPSTVLVICHKGRNVDKRTPLYKSCKAKGIAFESVPPRDYEIGGWLGDFVRSKALSMDAKAVSMLVDHLGADIARIANELDKLTTSLEEGTKRITADYIEQYIGISKDYNTFELTRALSEKNLLKALQIADYFARNPKENPFVVTLSILFTHFQRIFILNYQRWLARKEGRSLPSELELAKMLKLPAAFFLKEYTAAANLYPTPKVFSIFGLLRQYDMQSKGVESGSADDGELLKELILKIMMI